MSYDSRCYDLAEAFLSDSPEKDTEANRAALAQHIQDEIEGWIEFILKPAAASNGCACTSIDRSHCQEPDCDFASKAVSISRPQQTSEAK